MAHPRAHQYRGSQYPPRGATDSKRVRRDIPVGVPLDLSTVTHCNGVARVTEV